MSVCFSLLVCLSVVGHASDKPNWEWRGPEDQNSSSKRSWKLSMEKGRPLGHIKKYRHTHTNTHIFFPF